MRRTRRLRIALDIRENNGFRRSFGTKNELVIQIIVSGLIAFRWQPIVRIDEDSGR